MFLLRFNYSIDEKQRTGTSLIEVKNSEPILLDEGRPDANVFLYAVERKVYEKHKPDGPNKGWLDPKTPGVLAVSLEIPPKTVSSKNAITRYRVAIENGKLTAPMVPAEKQKSEAPGSPPNWAVGVGVAFAVTVFGQWLVRRRRVSIQ